MLALLLTVLPARAASWPAWELPAPLLPAGRGDLVFPDWFAGTWLVHSPDGSYPVRFLQRADGTVVGDRAFNTSAVGQLLLGEQLLEVRNDPANPNRQLARLQGDLQLESTVTHRRSEQPQKRGDEPLFYADELALQLLHGPAEPRVSRVETLSRYRLNDDGSIDGEQWQGSYASPAAGLAARPLHTGHWLLRLEPAAPGSDPAS
jgi:hypothetical protein